MHRMKNFLHLFDSLQLFDKRIQPKPNFFLIVIIPRAKNVYFNTPIGYLRRRKTFAFFECMLYYV